MSVVNWRSGTVVLLAAVAVLGIPSLPQHRYHLTYWCVAFVLEALLIAALWPLAYIPKDETGR